MIIAKFSNRSKAKKPKSSDSINTTRQSKEAVAGQTTNATDAEGPVLGEESESMDLISVDAVSVKSQMTSVSKNIVKVEI